MKADFKPQRRGDVLREIEKLDSQRDHQRIAYLSSAYDFPWDTQRAYELALLRSFAVPSSSHLLVSTGEFTERTQKRYDDTMLIISTIGLCGYDSPAGRAALRRMNQLHGRYQIPNDEFLYVLSTFVIEPLRWNARFGWRALSDKEKQAGFYFWREVGRRMNIQNIPETLADFEAFQAAYEAAHFAFDENNRVLAEVTKNLFLSWVLPRPLRFLGHWAVIALFDPPLRRAFGYADPPVWLEWFVTTALKFRAALIRFLPPRRKPATVPKARSYPQGYDIQQLGPPLK